MAGAGSDYDDDARHSLTTPPRSSVTAKSASTHAESARQQIRLAVVDDDDSDDDDPDIYKPLHTSAQVKSVIAKLEALIAAEQQEAAELEAERLESAAYASALNRIQPTEAEFYDQRNFRWAIPDAQSNVCVPPTVTNGYRVRPEIPSGRLPPVPAAPSTSLPFVEQEAQYADRYAALAAKREAAVTRRRAAEFDMEESLFGVPSSDDSDGYDEDFEMEWREETSDIFATCRSVECDPTNEEAVTAFASMCRRLANDASITNAERSMLWDAVRHSYRLAEPMHEKHWLAACHEVVDTGGFYTRPSVTNFSFLVHAAMDMLCWTDRQRRKVQRWAARATLLVRKRVAVLQEFGHKEPTWHAVNVACGGLSRCVRVPTMTLGDALSALTAASKQQEISSQTADLARPPSSSGTPTPRDN